MNFKKIFKYTLIIYFTTILSIISFNIINNFLKQDDKITKIKSMNVNKVIIEDKKIKAKKLRDKKIKAKKLRDKKIKAKKLRDKKIKDKKLRDKKIKDKKIRDKKIRDKKIKDKKIRDKKLRDKNIKEEYDKNAVFISKLLSDNKPNFHSSKYIDIKSIKIYIEIGEKGIFKYKIKTKISNKNLYNQVKEYLNSIKKKWRSKKIIKKISFDIEIKL